MGAAYSTPHIASQYYQTYVDSLPRMQGKVVVITGATTGIGFVVARTLVARGARVLMLNRPSPRAEAALKRVREEAEDSGAGGTADHIDCDLQSFASVRAAAERVQQAATSTGVDALVNNAGMMQQADAVTADGYEVQMQTNHLSHFLLTSLLMPLLELAASQRGTARIVHHSSTSRKALWPTPLAERYLRPGESFGGGGFLAGMERYHQSKLANMLMTYALQDRLAATGSKVVAAVAIPGLAATEFQANTTARGRVLGMSLFVRLFAQSAEDGSMPLLECVCRERLAPPAFYGPCHKGFFGWVVNDVSFGPPVLLQPEPLCTDPVGKALLWAESERATGPFTI